MTRVKPPRWTLRIRANTRRQIIFEKFEAMHIVSQVFLVRPYRRIHYRIDERRVFHVPRTLLVIIEGAAAAAF